MNGSPVGLAVESLGWTLLHFVWQGTLVAAVLYCLLAVARNASASVRYLMDCAALLVAAIAVMLTLAWQIDVGQRGTAQVSVAANHLATIDQANAGVESQETAIHVPDGQPAETTQAAVPAAVESSAADARVVDAETADSDLGFAALGVLPARLRGWLRGWLPMIVGLWAAGVALLSLRLFAGWRTIRRVRAAGYAIDDPDWIERFARLRERLGVSRTVRLLASASAGVPFVVGWLRPVVLMPAGLLTGLAPSEIEAIFAHELAHIRRHDYLVNLLQNVAETLLFYHPAVWWISAQIRQERENCCDDIAAAVCGGALDYAKALVALEQMRPATDLIVAASGGSLLARIRRLAGAGPSRPSRSAWPLPVLVLFVAAPIALLAAGRLSVGEQKDPKDESVLPTTFNGAEIIAWVGPEMILASDVLSDANRHLQKVLDHAQQPRPADEIERLRKLYMSKFLEQLIGTKLVVVEGRRNLPKEAWGKIEKQFNDQFDKQYLKKMIDSEECRSRTELDTKLRKAGSSLQAIRRQAMENSFAQHWLEEKASAVPEATRDEIEANYQRNRTRYEIPAQARCEHLMAWFDRFDTKEDARQAIESVRAELQVGKAFAEAARAEEIAVVDDGKLAWINQGSQVSKVLDEAMFALPIGEVSEIIEDASGFHILRVMERKQKSVAPLTEVEARVKTDIRFTRRGKKRQEYEAQLRKTIPVWNIFEVGAGGPKIEVPDEAADRAEGEAAVPSAGAVTEGSGETAAKPAADSTPQGIEILVVDAGTKQPIPQFRFLAATKMLSKAQPTIRKINESNEWREPIIWRQVQFHSGENGAMIWPAEECYEEMKLRIEADGYQALATGWVRLPRVTTESKYVYSLKGDAGIPGRVLQPDGKPAGGATVAIVTPERNAWLKNGQIAEAELGFDARFARTLMYQPIATAKTDGDGRFRIATETDPDARVLIVHESGVGQMTYADFQRQPDVKLDRWARIEGQVLWKDRPGANERIAASVRYDDPSVIVGGPDETLSDAEGRFVFEKVLPGDLRVARIFESPPSLRGWSIGTNVGPEAQVTAVSGERARVVIGGSGRTVKGQLTGRTHWEGVSLSFAPPIFSRQFPVRYLRPLNTRSQGAYTSQDTLRRWRTSPIGPLYFRDQIKPNADGSFAIPGVLPGIYLLVVSATDTFGVAAQGEYILTAERPGVNEATVDLGEVRVKESQANPPAGAGKPADGQSGNKNEANDQAAISGRVLDPDGKPATGAMVGIGSRKYGLKLKDGQVLAELERLLVKTDAEGHFEFPTPNIKPTMLLAAHESGATEMRESEFRQPLEVKLRRWGRIEGQVMWKDRPGAEQLIGSAVLRGNATDSAAVINTGTFTRSDAQGKFVFDKVLSGRVFVGGLMENTNGPGGSFGWHDLTVGEGEPTAVLVGGVGRTVTGRLTGHDSWEGMALKLAPPGVHLLAVSKDPAGLAQAQRYEDWRNGPVGSLFVHEQITPAADGSFTVPDVLPGRYQLNVVEPQGPKRAGLKMIEVAGERLGEVPPALDVGEVSINQPGRPVGSELYRGDAGGPR